MSYIEDVLTRFIMMIGDMSLMDRQVAYDSFIILLLSNLTNDCAYRCLNSVSLAMKYNILSHDDLQKLTLPKANRGD